MHARRVLNWTLAGLCGVAIGCSSSEGTGVQFKSGPQKGEWHGQSETGSMAMDAPDDSGDDHGNTPTPTSMSSGRGAGGSESNAAGSSTTAGRGGTGSTTSSGNGNGDSAAGSGSQMSAGAGGASGAALACTPIRGTAPLTDGSVTFEVTTLEQHPAKSAKDDAYGPQNIGAIWIQDGDTLIRSLEVWTCGPYLRELREYCKVRGGTGCAPTTGQGNRMSIDVATTATLVKHKHHIASWDLTNVEGKDVREVSTSKKYTLYIEVSDYDVAEVAGASNALNTIDFDIGVPGTRTDWVEAEHPYYSDMKLVVK